MDDDTLLRTVKNGLIIAGHEMGPVGDHWPAIHAITKGVEEEFFKMQTDEAVVGELEFRYANILHQYEEIADKSSPEDKKIIMEFVKQKWEEYYAILEPIDKKHIPKTEDIVIEGSSEYTNMAAAAQILNSMGGKLWQ
ncbi:MAG: hypothetical protein K2Q32_04690 [Alphaproteobacteria bacterium]|nr:hypothetical protein [Alphaproteobacteria bacterium]